MSEFDAFAELKIERCVDLDKSVLEAAFHEQSKSRHPDVGGTAEDFQKLTRARDVISGDASRLKHLAELAGADVESISRGAVSPVVADHFSPVAEVLQQAESVTRSLEKAQTALQKALLQKSVMQAQVGLGDQLAKLDEMAERFLQSISVIDDVAALSQASRDLAFIARWQGQLRAAFAGLWV